MQKIHSRNFLKLVMMRLPTTLHYATMKMNLLTTHLLLGTYLFILYVSIIVVKMVVSDAFVIK